MGAPPLTLAAIELRGDEARGPSDAGRAEALGSPSGLLPEAMGSPSGLLPEAPNADECWTICYTPGTEGQPKGVMWTHENVRALTSELVPLLPAPEKPGREPEVQLLAMPLAQAFTRAMLWTGLVGPLRAKSPDGAGELPLVTALARSESTLFEDARVLRPTIMVGVPSIYERARAEVMRTLKGGGAIPALVASWAREARDLEGCRSASGMRYGIAEGIGKPARTKRFGVAARPRSAGWYAAGAWCAGLLPPARQSASEASGLVETVVALTHLDVDPKPTIGCVGRSLPGIEWRIGPDDEPLLRVPR